MKLLRWDIRLDLRPASAVRRSERTLRADLAEAVRVLTALKLGHDKIIASNAALRRANERLRGEKVDVLAQLDDARRRLDEALAENAGIREALTAAQARLGVEQDTVTPSSS